MGRNSAPYVYFGTKPLSTLWNETRKRLSNACAHTDTLTSVWLFNAPVTLHAFRFITEGLYHKRCVESQVNIKNILSILLVCFPMSVMWIRTAEKPAAFADSTKAGCCNYWLLVYFVPGNRGVTNISIIEIHCALSLPLFSPWFKGLYK